MKSENSVWLSRTRFVIRGHFRKYILFAGLQLSITPVILLSIYCLSSVDIRLSSLISHLSVSSSLFFTAMSTLATGGRLLSVGTAPVWSELVWLSYCIAFGELCLVLFFNQCDWVIDSYHIIVLRCLQMSWCNFVTDLINVLRVDALVKSCVWMELILRVMGRIV